MTAMTNEQLSLVIRETQEELNRLTSQVHMLERNRKNLLSTVDRQKAAIKALIMSQAASQILIDRSSHCDDWEDVLDLVCEGVN